MTASLVSAPDRVNVEIESTRIGNIGIEMPVTLDSSCGRRFHVVGTTGSGKTTLARNIARRLGIPHVELDAIHWEPNWTPAPLDVFRERATQALSTEAWAVDGNYSKVRDIIWRRADTVVWLDYPLRVVMWRLTKRTLRRIVTREVLWDSNRETFRAQFFSRDSLFLWALQTYPRRKREYPALLSRPEYRHLAMVRLRSPQEADEWLSLLPLRVRAATDHD